jgi:hypothetical protein
LFVQDFYARYIPLNPLSETYSYEASTVDDMALAQLIIASIVSTIGEPFRKAWYRNLIHVSIVLVQSVWVLIQVFAPYNEFISDILSLKPLPKSFGIQLLGLMICNGLISGCISYLTSLFLVKRNHRRKLWKEFSADFWSFIRQYYKL